jgi:hypothetical protein
MGVLCFFCKHWQPQEFDPDSNNFNNIAAITDIAG